MTLRSSDFKSDVSTDFTIGADFYKLLHASLCYIKALIKKAFFGMLAYFKPFAPTDFAIRAVALRCEAWTIYSPWKPRKVSKLYEKAS